MPNNITAPRVPLTDPRTGLIHREWYRFFFSLYDLVLSGNTASIADLMVGPEGGAQLAQLVALTKAFQATQVEPPPPDTLGLIKALQGLAVVPQQVDLSVVTKALQALQLAPVPVPATPAPLALTTTATPTTIAPDTTALLVNVAGAAAVTLPVPTSNRRVTVKDASGAAGVNNITVSPPSGSIDGAATFVLSSNYQSVDFLADGTNYWVV